jgi:replication factor A1
MELEAKEAGQIILKHTELDAEEIRNRTQAKIEEFDGIVGKPAACVLVGRENGLDMSKLLGIERNLELDVENLVEDMNSVDIDIRVEKVYSVNTFDRDDGSTGRVRNVLLEDGTGTTKIAFWDEETEIASNLDEGQKLRIEDAYSKYDDYNDAVELCLGDSTKIIDRETDETILNRKSEKS